MVMRLLRLAATGLMAILLVSTPAIAADDWTLGKDEDGIRVYSRVPETVNQTAREIRAVVEIEATPEALLSLVLDYPIAPEWRQSIKEMTMYERIDDTNWFIKVVTDLPWPLSDREMVIKVELHRDAETGTIIYAFHGAGEFAETEAQRQETESLVGYFRFTPKENGRTEATYQSVFASPLPVPGWIIDRMIYSFPYNQMSEMRKRSSDKKYSQASIP